MKIFKCDIKLLDPLFYAREGLSGSFTPPYIHATALNYSIKKALNYVAEDQPLIVSGEKGLRNVPNYKNSIVSNDFYFTPARLISNLKYFSEITKGETDGFIVKAGRTTMGELFQAGVLHYISPESKFECFLISFKDFKYPNLIRLGSFRGKAEISYHEAISFKTSNKLVTLSHPVDPLVMPIKRGVMINMFPYPLVDNAKYNKVVFAFFKEEKIEKIIGFPEDWNLPESENIKIGKSGAII